MLIKSNGSHAEGGNDVSICCFNNFNVSSRERKAERQRNVSQSFSFEKPLIRKYVSEKLSKAWMKGMFAYDGKYVCRQLLNPSGALFTKQIERFPFFLLMYVRVSANILFRPINMTSSFLTPELPECAKADKSFREKLKWK